MKDRIVHHLTEEAVKGIASQFNYRGFIISMSTAFRESPEVCAWSTTTSDDQNFATVQEAIEWVDKTLY